MQVYRVAYRAYAKAPLDGEGSFLYGGRWSSVGTRMVYMSSALTLAMLEFLAHVDVGDFDPNHAPELIYVAAIVPDAAVLSLDAIGVKLPANWSDLPAPAIGAAIGDGWIREVRPLGLSVPSVHIPSAMPERNVLLNPLHPRFSEVHHSIDELTYDRRLLATRRTRESATDL